MTRNLQIYSLALFISLLLWSTSGRADYGSGSGCPNIAVPVELSGDDVWASYDDDGNSSEDYRGLNPVSGTDIYITYDGDGDQTSCELFVGEGTYYDAGNHLWTLDNDLNCYGVDYQPGDFRGGEDY